MDQELKTYLDSKFADLDGKVAKVDAKFADLDGKFVDMENRLIEKMRDMQTELLRGFESFSTAQTIRLRKLEADQSNLDTSLRGRVDVLETRLTQIELRLGKHIM